MNDSKSAAAVVNIHEAKTHLSRLVERAHRGEEIILAKAGKPYARLVPLEEHRERVPGVARGRVTEAFFEPLPEEELAAWER
jgi:prevent-host-death family protein